MKLSKDFPRYAERPRCRKIIKEMGWYPLLFQWDGEIYWDGIHMMDTAGKSVLMSDGMTKQARRMLQESHWGQLDVTIDFTTWCRLFDSLHWSSGPLHYNVIQLDLSNSTKGEQHES